MTSKQSMSLFAIPVVLMSGCCSTVWYSGDGSIHTNEDWDRTIILPSYVLGEGTRTFKVRHPPSDVYEPGFFVRDEQSVQSAKGTTIRVEVRKDDGTLIVECHGEIGKEWDLRDRHQQLTKGWHAYLGASYLDISMPLPMSVFDSYTVSVSARSGSRDTTLEVAPVLLDSRTPLP
jgi:hypothetical protein